MAVIMRRGQGIASCVGNKLGIFDEKESINIAKYLDYDGGRYSQELIEIDPINEYLYIKPNVPDFKLVCTLAFYSFRDRNITPLKWHSLDFLKNADEDLKPYLCAKYSSKENTFLFSQHKYEKAARFLGLDPEDLIGNCTLTLDEFVERIRFPNKRYPRFL